MTSSWFKALVLSCVMVIFSKSLWAQGPVPDSFHIEPSDLIAQANKLKEIVENESAQKLLKAVAMLPEVSPRKIYWRREGESEVLSAFEYEVLSSDERIGFRELAWSTKHYYSPLFGTPLAYVRPLEIAAFELEGFAHKRILDFGYGGITQLRLLASCGAHAVGVDPNDFLKALYTEPSDQGLYPLGHDDAGTVTLVHGYWPADETTRLEVGEDFDLIVSRNVLKRGYIRPIEKAPAYTQIDLKSSHLDFRMALFKALKPGGLFLIYNTGFAPSGQDAIYQAQDDIVSPYTESEWEKTGFEVMLFNEDDSEINLQHSLAFGWFQAGGGERLKASYSLFRKPENSDR